MKSLQTLKSRLKQRVAELEEELKKVKEEAEKLARASKSDDEVKFFPLKTLKVLQLFLS